MTFKASRFYNSNHRDLIGNIYSSKDKYFRHGKIRKLMARNVLTFQMISKFQFLTSGKKQFLLTDKILLEEHIC